MVTDVISIMATCIICNVKIDAHQDLHSGDRWTSFYQGMEAMNSHYIKCFTKNQQSLSKSFKASETRAVTAEAEAKIYRELIMKMKLVPKDE